MSRVITPKGLRLIIAITVIGAVVILLSAKYGPRVQQIRNMAAAERHISVLKPTFDRDPRFARIELRPFTAEGGSLRVSGKLSSEQDLADLQRVIEASNAPVKVVYQVLAGPLETGEQ